MKHWFMALLATTSLYGVDKARADVVWASQTGAFGQSLTGATVLAGPSSTIYNDLDQRSLSRGPDYFSIALPAMGFTLTLTAARAFADSFGNYYSSDQIDQYSGSPGGSASASLNEGQSTVVATALPSFGGTGVVTTPAASGSSSSNGSGSVVSVSLTAASGPVTSEGASYVIPSATLDPILTFYDDASNELAIVEITEGNSIVVSGALSGQSTLNFSVSAPFDYTVQLDAAAADVPEPAGVSLLGLGAAGAALARRRKRVV